MITGPLTAASPLRIPARSQKRQRPGQPRFGVVEDVIAALDPGRLIFEAPTKDLQTFFVTRLGSDVNLASIAPADVIALETLRLGLRSDTLVHSGLERQGR